MTEPGNQISNRNAALVIGAALTIGLGVLATNYDPRRSSSIESWPPAIVNTTGVNAASLPVSRFLEIGESAPELLAEWLRQPGGDEETWTGKLTVVDLWDDWCPFARELSPGLIAMKEEYAEKPVDFVSLTIGAAPLQDIAPRGWRSGYSAGRSLTDFHCLFDDLTYGVAVHPTIYLIGPDGKVLWCDNGMREQHAEADDVEKSVREAIEAALLTFEPPETTTRLSR